MNLQIYQKNILPPTNVTINYMRTNSCLVVTWNEIKNPNKNNIKSEIKKICYNIYKGSGQNGIYYKMNNEPLNSNRYEDYNLSKNPEVINWYKISTVYLDENGNYIEGATSIPVCYRTHNTDKWWYKINERNRWILMNTGTLFDYYARKYEGERCPRCVDSVRSRASSSNCPICYGTSYVGGYTPVAQIYFRLKPVESSLNMTPQGYVQNVNASGWCITSHRIHSRDILIGPTGTIYSVLSSNTDFVQTDVLFHTEVNLKIYDPNDQIYNMKRTVLYPEI